MADEVQNLIIRAQGEVELNRINKLLDQQSALFQKIMGLQAQHGPSTQYTKALERTGAKIIEFNKQMKDLEKSLPPGLEGRGGGRFGTQGMQQLGYALQDFTSASGGFAQRLNAISNNLQMVAVSLGIGGGWFVAITGLVTALQLLSNNSDKIESWILGLDPAKVKKAGEKMAEAMSIPCLRTRTT